MQVRVVRPVAVFIGGVAVPKLGEDPAEELVVHVPLVQFRERGNGAVEEARCVLQVYGVGW